MSEAREDLFANMARNFEKIIARQVMEPIEVPELEDETGVPRWHIKDPPGWALALFTEFSIATDQVQYACGFIVAHAHDMFGEPIFYDNKMNGQEVPLKIRISVAKQSREKLVLTFGDENIVEVMSRIVDAKKKLEAEQGLTPEDVKTQSSTETTT